MVLQFSAVAFEELPGWNDDTILDAVPALLASAKIVLEKQQSFDHESPFLFYQEVSKLWSHQKDEVFWRQVLKKFFIPHRLSFGEQTEAFFTGYYEPLLRGSLKCYGSYQTPLYKLPPFPTRIPRQDIVNGGLTGKNLELVWVDDPIGAFFLQIQGSGRVCLENGEILHLGYDGTNQHPYYAIGRTLVKRGIMAASEVTLQTLQTWLREHPAESESLMSENTSYVFFKLLTGEGPLGTQGVPLTPQRSLAVDPVYHPLGRLMWVDLPHPEQKNSRLQHLMVAQDTGGAIKGGLRGDYFWGFGDSAERCAGQMNVRGTLYALLPIQDDR